MHFANEWKATNILPEYTRLFQYLTAASMIRNFNDMPIGSLAGAHPAAILTLKALECGSTAEKQI